MELSNKTIHDCLLAIAESYPLNSTLAPKEVYEQYTFKLRCIPSRTAIRRMAEKFKTQKTFTTTTRSSGTKPRSSSLVYNEMIRDKEYKQAIDFWLLKHDAPHFGAHSNEISRPLPQGVEFKEGYLCHIDYIQHGYNVTHLQSGRACGSDAPTQAKAIAKFKAIDQERLARAINALGSEDFQATARKKWLLTN